VESRLTDLRFVEEKCRSVDPYHLLTDFSAALDTPSRFIPPQGAEGGGGAEEAGAAPGLSFLQRVRVLDFRGFVSMYAAVFAAHPEIVLQQAMNMPDASTVAGEALRIVGDAKAEVAWFKHLNKSQLGDPCVLTLRCNGPVDCVVYAPDGHRLATGAGDGFGGRLSVWDARSGVERAQFSMPGAIKALSFAGDGRSLLCVADEGTVMICDATTLKERLRAVLSSTQATGGALSIDGRRMALVARDGVINVWDVASRVSGTGQVVSEAKKVFELLDEDLEGRPTPLTCVAIGPSGRRVFAGTSHGLLKVFSLSPTEGLAVMHALEGHRSVVGACGFNADGLRACTCSLDRYVKVWDVERGGKEVASFTDGAEARGCAFSPDGAFVAAGVDSGKVHLYDLTTGQAVFSFGTHAGRVNTVAFAPSGRFVASGSTDGTCKVWGIKETAAAEDFTGHPGTDAVALTYSADGGELASAAGDGSLKLWGGRRGAELMAFPGHPERISACCFSPLVGDGVGGVLTASLYDGSVRRWDNLTGTEAEGFRHASDYVSALAFSPDGTRVLAGSFDGSAIVWDASTRALLVKLGVEADAAAGGGGGWRAERIRDRHDDAVVACAFCPGRESERAATASADGTARVWNTRWGTCLATLRGHSAAVAGVVFSHDGGWLFTASADMTVREWRAEAPYRCLAVVAGHYGAVHGVALATSGRHLFSASEDRTLRAWLRVRLDDGGSGAPPAAAAAPPPRVGSRAYSSATASGRMEWFQWVQARSPAGTPAQAHVGPLE
jgi:WD40 repeat protein